MRFKSNMLRFVHNAIEAFFPIGKKLGEPIFTGLSYVQLQTTKRGRHGQKQVVITWCEMRPIRWMQKNLACSFLWLARGIRRC